MRDKSWREAITEHLVWLEHAHGNDDFDVHVPPLLREYAIDLMAAVSRRTALCDNSSPFQILLRMEDDGTASVLVQATRGLAGRSFDVRIGQRPARWDVWRHSPSVSNVLNSTPCNSRHEYLDYGSLDDHLRWLAGVGPEG